jgi:hypothetical protein
VTSSITYGAEVTFTLDTVIFEVLPAGLALREAVPVLSCLVKDAGFLARHVLPLLKETGSVEDWDHVCDRLEDGRTSKVGGRASAQRRRRQ